jgi:hypothetical protein
VAVNELNFVGGGSKAAHNSKKGKSLYSQVRVDTLIPSEANDSSEASEDTERAQRARKEMRQTARQGDVSPQPSGKNSEASEDTERAERI